MSYTILNLYRTVGQFDSVCNISFKKGSKAFDKWGENITGQIIYEPDERKALQERLEKDNQADQHGAVKFKVLLERLSPDSQNELRTSGFSSEDISVIINFPESVNQYANMSTRELPEQIVVPFKSAGFDEIRATFWLHSQYAQSGHKTTPFEKDKELAYRLLLNDGKIPPDGKVEEYIDEASGSIKNEIELALLGYQGRNGTVQDKERNRYRELLEIRITHNLALLEKELMRSTEKLKRVGVDYKKAYDFFFWLAGYFEPERLTTTKVPVWWNFERFLHIFMRHVAEVQIGERFKDKTTFQYAIQDIRRLIKLVLNQLVEDIDHHFANHPRTDYKRHGSMSVYFAGDYYRIHIRSDGLLLNFFKNN